MTNLRREFRRFDGDERFGTFKRRHGSWTNYNLRKKQPNYFKSRFFFLLNVKWPRFPVQMSEWCYRSQCSWFCFLFHLTGGASHRSLCPVRTRPIVSPTFFVCFSLSMNFFAVSCIFDFYGILYCCTSIIWVILNKTVKKINRRSVPPLSRALLGQPNSLKPGEVIALQITRSLSDNKVSVFINKSALHW